MGKVYGANDNRIDHMTIDIVEKGAYIEQWRGAVESVVTEEDSMSESATGDSKLSGDEFSVVDDTPMEPQVPTPILPLSPAVIEAPFDSSITTETSFPHPKASSSTEVDPVLAPSKSRRKLILSSSRRRSKRRSTRSSMLSIGKPSSTCPNISHAYSQHPCGNGTLADVKGRRTGIWNRRGDKSRTSMFELRSRWH